MIAALKEMGWVDLLATGLLLFLVVRGFVIGCSGEFGRLAAVLTASSLGYFGFVPLSRVVLEAHLFDSNPYAGKLVVFIILFVVCMTVWLLLSRLLSDAIRLVVPQPFDAILGGIVGGAKAFVLVALFCAFGMLNPVESERASLREGSFTVRHLNPILKRITEPLPSQGP